MYLREYSGQYFPAIEKLNPFCALSLQYHGDVQQANTLVIVDPLDEVVAVGFLKGDEKKLRSDKLVVELCIFIEDRYQHDVSVTTLLVDGLIQKFKQVNERAFTPNRVLKVFCHVDDTQEITFYQAMGFRINEILPVLSCDLTKDTKHFPLPDGVHIEELPYTDENIHAYFTSASMATSDFESEAELRFRSGNPSFKCFAARCEANVVGAISVWNISKDRAATEDLFVAEAFRHRNIAKELLATAMDELKKREAQIATLSLRSSNSSAMKLYSSIGYSHYYDLVELIYT